VLCTAQAEKENPHTHLHIVSCHVEDILLPTLHAAHVSIQAGQVILAAAAEEAQQLGQPLAVLRVLNHTNLQHAIDTSSRQLNRSTTKILNTRNHPFDFFTPEMAAGQRCLRAANMPGRAE
jgi:hypothetical protein